MLADLEELLINTFMAAIFLALWLATLYPLIRFVKWAWMR